MTLRTISIDIGGRIYPFSHPDSENMRGVLAAIFNNQSYPKMGFLESEVDCVFDIGANVGAAAMYFHWSYPKARIYCFEPIREIFDILTRNVAPIAAVTPFHAGLFDRDCTRRLSIHGAGGEMSSIFADAAELGSETIRLLKASDQVSRLAAGAGAIVLKIDTEGCEVPILTDLAPLMPRIAVAHVEWHSEQDRIAIDGLMREAGMLLFGCHAVVPHRGEATYVQSRLVETRTDHSRQAISAT